MNNDNDMRITLSSWFLFLAVGTGTAIGAVAIPIVGLFNKEIVLGPTYAVNSPRSDKPLIEHTPITVDSLGLRMGWHIGLGAMLLAIAILLFTVGRMGRRPAADPLFSSESLSLLSKRWNMAFGLYIVGGLLQALLVGPIADSTGIVPSGYSTFGDFFGITKLLRMPIIPLLIIAMIGGWVLRQGAIVQGEAEGVV